MEFGKAMGAWVSAAEAVQLTGTLAVLCFPHAMSSAALALALAWEGMLAGH